MPASNVTSNFFPQRGIAQVSEVLSNRTTSDAGMRKREQFCHHQPQRAQRHASAILTTPRRQERKQCKRTRAPSPKTTHPIKTARCALGEAVTREAYISAWRCARRIHRAAKARGARVEAKMRDAHRARRGRHPPSTTGVGLTSTGVHSHANSKSQATLAAMGVHSHHGQSNAHDENSTVQARTQKATTIQA